MPWRVNGWSRGETCRDRQKSGIMGGFLNLRLWERSDGETCCVQKFRKFREFSFLKQKMATQCSDVSSSSTSHGESQFDRSTSLWPKSSGWLEWPRRGQRCMVYVHERHAQGWSSSWSGLHGESTIYQESTPEVCETAIPSDWKVNQGSDRNQWSDHDWL